MNKIPNYGKKSSGSLGLIIACFIGVLVVICAIAGFMIYSLNNRDQKNTKLKTDTPAAFTLGNKNAPTKSTISIFEDPLCPVCGDFENSASGKQILQLIRENRIQVKYYILDFLNDGSASKTYSTRAVATYLAVNDSTLNSEEKDKVLTQLHDQLYNPAIQPKEQAPTDLTNDQLALQAEQAAKTVGTALPQPTIEAIQKGTFDEKAKTEAADSLKALTAFGGQGTPSFIYDGKLIEYGNADFMSKVGSSKWLDSIAMPAQAQKPTQPPVAPPKQTIVPITTPKVPVKP